MKSKLPKEMKWLGGVDRWLYRKHEPYFTIEEATQEAEKLKDQKYSVYVTPFNDKYILYISQQPNRVRGMISGLGPKQPKEYLWLGGSKRLLYRKDSPFFTFQEAKLKAKELYNEKYTVYRRRFNDKYVLYVSDKPNQKRGLISGQAALRIHTIELPEKRTDFYLQILQKNGIKVKN